MSAAKHTPGPWSLHAHMGGEHTTDCSEDHGFIAHTCHIGAGDILLAEVEAYRYTSGESSGFARVSDFDECRANARLIAAAPELLEALKAARDDLRVAGFDATVSMLDEAIAKATRSQP